jgi:hypothetical protein
MPDGIYEQVRLCHVVAVSSRGSGLWGLQLLPSRRSRRHASLRTLRFRDSPRISSVPRRLKGLTASPQMDLESYFRLKEALVLVLTSGFLSVATTSRHVYFTATIAHSFVNHQSVISQIALAAESQLPVLHRRIYVSVIFIELQSAVAGE